MTIIDSHIHVFDRLGGRSGRLRTESGYLGRIKIGREEKAFIPPSAGETSFPFEVLDEMMDLHGVSKAVIMQNPTIGIINDYINSFLKNRHDRYTAVLQVDPRVSDSVATLRRMSEKPWFRAVKLEMSSSWGWTGIYDNLRYTDPAIYDIVGAASDSGLHVVIDTGPVGNPGYDLDGLRRLVRDFSGTIFQIEHLGYLLPENRHNKRDLAEWERCIRLGLNENVYLGYSAVGSLLEDEYPCESAVRLLQSAVSIVGAEKILWGSDAPVTLNRYTYGQMIEGVLKYSGLSRKELELIMGGNAERLYFQDRK